jgi:uncharacterized membrane protein YphA (DoxX/SURF4 family)
MKIGIWILGLASAASGLFDLLWRGFDPSYQPIQAFGDHVPGVTVMAIIAALALIIGGLSMLVPRTTALGATILMILYAVFAGFFLPRFITAPHYLGHGIATYIGVFAGMAQLLILAIAAALVRALARRRSLSSSGALFARSLFGLCSIDFGLAHCFQISGVARLVPSWIPGSGPFWAVFTGIAFILAGLAILTGVLDVLAARLLALMLLVFSLVVVPRFALHAPHSHGPWGSNAYNLAAVAAAWILADWLAARHRESALPSVSSPNAAPA